jgi:8-oxo-dGTP pyrophosphatase MutT (NUDIX family)
MLFVAPSHKPIEDIDPTICRLGEAGKSLLDQKMSTTYRFTSELQQRMADNLACFQRREIKDPELRRAGVALVVAPATADGGACLLLTRRSKKLRRHAGQYALPGGRLDEGESFQDAALRELSEELGLEYDGDAVLGTLDDYQTQSGFCIRPFVIWGGSLADLAPDPVEVAIVHQVPLEDLDNPEIPRLTPNSHSEHPLLGAPLASIGDVIHAPTAALLYQFREVAMHGRATRVAHFGQPEFTWK